MCLSFSAVFIDDVVDVTADIVDDDAAFVCACLADVSARLLTQQ